MSIEYKGLLKAAPESEEVKMKVWTPQPSSRLSYVLGILCALLFLIIILLIVLFRTPVEKPTDRTTEYQIGNLSESMTMKVGQLSQDGAKVMEKLQQMDTALKTIQTDTSIGQLQGDMQRVLVAISKMSDRIRKLDNGSEEMTCPSGWSRNHLSCYLYSGEGKSWQVSKKICEAKKAYLVVINSEEEQNFLFGLSKGKYTWIGLTDTTGAWKWVDGTKYEATPHNWIPGQPDEFYGHGLGGGEDCAHLHTNGQWNDDHCSRPYSYICEMMMIGRRLKSGRDPSGHQSAGLLSVLVWKGLIFWNSYSPCYVYRSITPMVPHIWGTYEKYQRDKEPKYPTNTSEEEEEEESWTGQDGLGSPHQPSGMTCRD
ncbi:asialoglycoprotein receptor 1-like [Leptodactylus fuscus]|uniref:asialoglycoprotein receptor 1-like n=1 Tax=Leptodactylus fuscus TaxID=238119 RepID=UPI003F4EAB71